MPSTHRRLLDAFGGLEKDVGLLEMLWDARRAANAALDEHRAGMERAAREADYLRHASDELKTLAPKDGEETALAERRTVMMQGEKIAADLREAQDAVAGDHSPVAALSAAVRRLERRAANSPALVEPAVKAIDIAINALEEADQHLTAALRAADFDPAELERIEERLFALRAASRKYSTPVDKLAALAAQYAADVALIDAGAEQLKKLEAAAEQADERYAAAAKKLSAAREKAARKLDKAVNAELAPLKLERATFTTQIESDPASPGPQGFDRVEFWVQTNPGTRPGPLMKVASGGELSRFLLALKVVLADRGSAPTLVFDEIDTGVGGAVADAIGTRLARLASKVQVMAVTHAPQVAARAGQHLLISKDALDKGKRVATRVNALAADHRREEIARMLAGAEITAEARAAAERLLKAATVVMPSRMAKAAKANESSPMSPTSPRRRPRPSTCGWRWSSKATTGATIRTTRPASPTPNTTRCGRASTPSRSAFRNSSARSRRRRRSAPRRPDASGKSATRCRCSRSTTPLPRRTSPISSAASSAS